MPEPGTERLLTFARKLHRATDFAGLIEVVAEEAREVTGYRHAWLMIGESETLETFRLIDISSVHRELAWEVAPVLTVKGDAFLEELVRTALPLVIVDARIDPRTNKEIVERLQNRTLINIPLQILDRPHGLVRGRYLRRRRLP